LCFIGAPAIDPEVAAVRVQKHWKGFAQRRRAKREREDEMMFIGMVCLPNLSLLYLNPMTAVFIGEN